MIIHIIIKDLKRMLRDKKALIITILMPFVLITILGFSIGKTMGNEINITPAKIAIVNLDNIEADKEEMKAFLSQGLIADNLGDSDKDQLLKSINDLDFASILIDEVLSTEQVKEFITFQVMDEETALEQIENGDLTSVVIIPEKFSFNTWINMFLPLKNPIEMEIVQNPDQELKAGIVKNIITGFTDRLSAGIIAKNTLLEAAVEFNAGNTIYQHIDYFIEELLNNDFKQAKTEYISIEGKNRVSGFQYYAAAMSAMFILYTAVYGASYSLDEKRFYTFERLKASGVKLSTILAGRYFSTALFTLIQLLFLIISSFLIFNILWGSWFSVFLLTAGISLAIASLSVLLSVINIVSNSERLGIFFQTMIIPLISIAGGSFVPNTSMPSPIRFIGDLTINGATLKGYVKLMQGYSLFDLQTIFINFTLFILIMLISAFSIVKTREV